MCECAFSLFKRINGRDIAHRDELGKLADDGLI